MDVLSLCSPYCFSCIINNLVVASFISSFFDQVSHKIFRPGFKQFGLIFHFYINDPSSPSLVPCSVFPVPAPFKQRACSVNCEFDQFYPGKNVGRLQCAPCWHCQHSCVIIRASFPSSSPKQEGYRKSASVLENIPKKI